MRMPSSERLQSRLGLTPEQARLVRSLGRAADDGEVLETIVRSSCPDTERYVGQMHSNPYRSPTWRTTVALHAMDEVLGTHGVEGLGPPSGSSFAPPYEYLNTGDSYTATLVYRRRTNTLTISSWGDIAERHPNWE